MTNPDYRAELQLLFDAAESFTEPALGHHRPWADALDRARALLAQPVAEGPKPVVDYSRVTEIATEAQIRSAAQYLVKKRNCDGDLIPAIEYAIARWGRPTPQPVAASERLPGPEDCDEQGWCWQWGPDINGHLLPGAWMLQHRDWLSDPDCDATHWLPANALPIPAQ